MSDEQPSVDSQQAEDTTPDTKDPTPDLVDGMEKLLDETQEAVANEQSSAASNPRPLQLNELSEEKVSDVPKSIELLNDVDLDLRIELGRTNMRLEDVLQLRSGSVVALDRLAGDPVDIFVNDRLVAKGEVLVLNENFCVRVTDLVTGGKES